MHYKMKIYSRAVVLNYLKDGTLWGYYEGYDESSIQKNTYMQNTTCSKDA